MTKAEHVIYINGLIGKLLDELGIVCVDYGESILGEFNTLEELFERLDKENIEESDR